MTQTSSGSFVEGACLCGALRLAAPVPPLFVAHCHCRWCRAAHGAAYVTWVGCRAEAVRWLAGERDVRWYASSATSERGFCPTCGTTLFYRSAALCPGELHVVRTAFADDAPLEPTVHVFHDQRAPWAEHEAALPRVDSAHPGLAKFGAVAPRR